MKRRTILKSIGASGIAGVAGTAAARHTTIEDASALRLEVDGEWRTVEMPDDTSDGVAAVTVDGVTRRVDLSTCCDADCCDNCPCTDCCLCANC